MDDQTSRRGALKCLGVGAGTLFTLSSGVFGAINLAEAAKGIKANPGFLRIEPRLKT